MGKTIRKELDSHKKLNTWTETEIPVDIKAIETRWLSEESQSGGKRVSRTI